MTDDLQHILSSKRELLARGNAPRPAVNYTEDMSSDQKDRFTEYLIEQNESLKLDLRAMHAVLEDMKDELAKSNDSLLKSNEVLAGLQSEISSLRSELQQEREERKVLEREISVLRKSWLLPTRTFLVRRVKRVESQTSPRLMQLQMRILMPIEAKMRMILMEHLAVYKLKSMRSLKR